MPSTILSALPSQCYRHATPAYSRASDLTTRGFTTWNVPSSTSLNVNATFFQGLDVCVAVQNTPIRLDFEGLEASRLQGVHNILYGLLASILQSHSV